MWTFLVNSVPIWCIYVRIFRQKKTTLISTHWEPDGFWSISETCGSNIWRQCRCLQEGGSVSAGRSVCPRWVSRVNSGLLNVGGLHQDWAHGNWFLLFTSRPTQRNSPSSYYPLRKLEHYASILRLIHSHLQSDLHSPLQKNKKWISTRSSLP